MNNIKIVHNEQKREGSNVKTYDRARVYLNEVELKGIVSVELKIDSLSGITETTLRLLTPTINLVHDEEQNNVA